MMKPSLLLLVILGTLPVLTHAAEFSVQIRSVETTVPNIEKSGFDTMLLPLREPVNPAKPERGPLDGSHPFRGLLTPEQNAVLTRASEQAFGPLKPETPKRLTPPSTVDLIDRSGKTIFSFAADLSPDQALQATIGAQEIKIGSGQTLLFSFPGASAQSAIIYLVTITKG